MKLYVVILEDRHTDVEVSLYADKDKAVESARATAHESARGGWKVSEEIPKGAIGDWLYHANYGEDCNVRVEETEVHA